MSSGSESCCLYFCTSDHQCLHLSLPKCGPAYPAQSSADCSLTLEMSTSQSLNPVFCTGPSGVGSRAWEISCRCADPVCITPEPRWPEQGRHTDGQDERMRSVGLCAGAAGAGRAALRGQVAWPLLRLPGHELEPRCQLPLLWQQALATPAAGWSFQALS